MSERPARTGVRSVTIYLALLLLLGVGGAGRADAQTFTSPSGDVTVTIEPAYSPFGMWGVAPLLVAIENGTARDREWSFVFISSEDDARRQHRHEVRLSVLAGQTRQVELLVPILDNPEGSYALWALLSGYGIDAAVPIGPTYWRRDPRLGVTPRIESAITEELQKELYRSSGKDARPAAVCRFAADFDPRSWRSLAGLDAIWMRHEDLSAWSATGRQALADWVMQGGHLTLFGPDDASRIDLPLPGATRATGRLGAGQIDQLRWHGQPITRSLVWDLVPLSGRNDLLGTDSKLAKTTPAPEPARGPLTLFILGLFAVAGPLNVFYLTRGRRVRLLLTTPAIAVGASALLSAVILLQDGFGGSGTRYVAHLLEPEIQRELVVQDQIARTGVLWSRSFQISDDTSLDRFRLGDHRMASWRFFTRDRDYAGDWFRSRAVQAHALLQVRPSRARVEISGRGTAQDPYRALSSLPAALSELYYVDRDGLLFTAARSVSPGEPVDLSPASGPAATADQTAEIFTHALPGGALRWLLESQRARPGYFYGVAAEDERRMLPTLESLDWDDRLALYLGPAVQRESIVPTPGAGAGAGSRP